MTKEETFAACGFYLQTGHFSSRILNTDSSDAKLFINCIPNFFLTLDGRLFQLIRGAQSDGISAGQIANAIGRGAGGDDWVAGWYHDAAYRFTLKIWDGDHWVKWDAAHGRSKPASDALLHEVALACGDTDEMADILYWAVTEFGNRNYQIGA